VSAHMGPVATRSCRNRPKVWLALIVIHNWMDCCSRGVFGVVQEFYIIVLVLDENQREVLSDCSPWRGARTCYKANLNGRFGAGSASTGESLPTLRVVSGK